MTIKKGSDRIVITFPNQGLVVKIARIRIFSAIYWFFKEILCRNWSALRMRLFHPMRMPHSVVGAVLRGLIANWMEFYFYQWTRHPVLQPTLFSLFGLLNIQKYSEPCGKKNDPFLYLREVAGYRAVSKDMHHFGNPKNFSVVNGKLRFLDYGSKETRKFIRQYGRKVYEQYSS